VSSDSSVCAQPSLRAALACCAGIGFPRTSSVVKCASCATSAAGSDSNRLSARTARVRQHATEQRPGRGSGAHTPRRSSTRRLASFHTLGGSAVRLQRRKRGARVIATQRSTKQRLLCAHPLPASRSVCKPCRLGRSSTRLRRQMQASPTCSVAHQRMRAHCSAKPSPPPAHALAHT
jgi:hypothetical protein